MSQPDPYTTQSDPYTTQSTQGNPPDKLDELFKMQTHLNEHVFKTKNITDAKGEQLHMFTLYNDAHSGSLTARSISVQWACKYLAALQAEAVETDEELPKKWWSDRAVALDRLQEEVIDQLHFWISLAISVGMGPESVLKKYMQKNAVNLKRMNEGYVERSKLVGKEFEELAAPVAGSGSNE